MIEITKRKSPFICINGINTDNGYFEQIILEYPQENIIIMYQDSGIEQNINYSKIY